MVVGGVDKKRCVETWSSYSAEGIDRQEHNKLNESMERALSKTQDRVVFIINNPDETMNPL